MKANKKQNKNQEKTASKQKSNKRYLFFALLTVAVVLTAIIYKPSLENGWTNWDDPGYVLENEIIKSTDWDNIKKIFSESVFMNYHPLTIISYAIEYKHFGYDAKPYHTTNYIFHLLNVLLVFLFVYFLSRKNNFMAFFVALLFGIHPMHVESVAWIAERKDVLYAFFFMLSLIFYVLYTDKKKALFYVLTILFFILSLLSKAMAVTLPLLLILIDFFRERKLLSRKVIIEKIPFFVLGLIFGIITIKIQSQGAIAKEGAISYFEKLLVASYGFMMYISKLFVPIKLSTLYPYPRLDETGTFFPTIFYIAPFVVLSVFAFIVLVSKKIKEFKIPLVFGILFFAFAISIVLQIITVGQAVMADRYTYIPYLGLIYSLGFLIYYFSKNQKYSKLKIPVIIITAAWTIYIGYQTTERIKVWKNSETLWTDVIENYPYAKMAYRNRGNFYGQNQKPDLAMKDYLILKQNNDLDHETWGNMGNIYRMKNQHDKALEAYQMSVNLDSTYAEGYVNRGISLSIAKRYDEAIADFSKAISMGYPKHKVLINRSYTFLYSGKYDEAESDFNYLIRVQPNLASHYFGRALSYYQMNKFQKAVDDFEIVLRFEPNNKDANYNASVCYNRLGQKEKALEKALKAKQLGREVSDSYINGLKN